jgi:hypothetical protein
MSMYALLRNNPNPTQQQIESAIDGNLCRCTGYRAIMSAFSVSSNSANTCYHCCMNLYGFIKFVCKPTSSTYPPHSLISPADIILIGTIVLVLKTFSSSKTGCPCGKSTDACCMSSNSNQTTASSSALVCMIPWILFL